jgi:hypothetical protein
MQGQSYDLNIDNYTYDDILLLFKIDKEKNYRLDELTERMDIMIEKSRKSENLHQFLVTAKNKIINIVEKPLLGIDTFPNTHNVQYRPVEPVKNIYNYKFPVGRENPIERRYIKKVVCFDTLFRVNNHSVISTNCTFFLPKPVENVISMKLISIDIPVMWPAFSDSQGNNYFFIKTYNVTGEDDTVYKIIIPSGNYTNDIITQSITNYFSNSGIIALSYFIFSVSNITSKSSIRVANNDDYTGNNPYDPSGNYYSPDFYYEICFDQDFTSLTCNNNYSTANQINKPIYRTAGWMLGFRKRNYLLKKENTIVDSYGNSSSQQTFYGYLESESSFGSSIYDYVFLDVDDFNKNFITDTFTSLVEKSYIGNNILARIPITSSYFNIINDSGSEHIFKQRDYFGPVKLEKIDIRLLNKFGDVIDLLGNNFSFALEFTVLYSS